MDKYEVMLYPKAIKDIDGIYNYIANIKLSPENAKSQTDRIWNALNTLETFPQSHQFRTTGKYSGKTYRQLLIDNYVAFYKIDENKKIVWIVTVQYQGQNN